MGPLRSTSWVLITSAKAFVGSLRNGVCCERYGLDCYMLHGVEYCVCWLWFRHGVTRLDVIDLVDAAPYMRDTQVVVPTDRDNALGRCDCKIGSHIWSK
jgi:hypothetical protein